MNEQDISATEAAINKAIAIMEEAEASMLETDKPFFDSLAHVASGWANIALAISEHNRNVTVFALAEAARAFVKTPSPEHYAELSAAVEQYIELG